MALYPHASECCVSDQHLIALVRDALDPLTPFSLDCWFLPIAAVQEPSVANRKRRPLGGGKGRHEAIQATKLPANDAQMTIRR